MKFKEIASFLISFFNCGVRSSGMLSISIFLFIQSSRIASICDIFLSRIIVISIHENVTIVKNLISSITVFIVRFNVAVA